MKKIYVLSLVLLLSMSFAGCVKDREKTSGNASDTSSIVNSVSDSVSISKDAVKSSSASVSNGNTTSKGNTTSENAALQSQLDDLKNVLSSLDQLSEGDLEIPTP